MYWRMFSYRLAACAVLSTSLKAMMPRYNRDTARTFHGYHRDMDFIQKVKYRFRYYIVYFEVSGHES